MRDFTLNMYESLIQTGINAGYSLVSYEDFIRRGQSGKCYILRHDVDKYPSRSFDTARIEAKAGVRGTYYFRIVRQSFDPEIIQAIAELGHEIGYHYEDLALCHGNMEKAYENYKVNLEKIRKYYPVTTICMHGSPLSKWDNRLLWEKYDYKKSGILAEPYFDTDFSKVYYLTDTGRTWNGSDYSIRDKVTSPFNIRIRSTSDLIEKLKSDLLPLQVMQNIHPQRWTNDLLPWTSELILQNIKNVIKPVYAKIRK